MIIGFDRPLRPEWIYETLLLVKPKQKIKDLSGPFENIARELTGKRGKANTRKVLVRCFIRDEQDKTVAREKNPLKELTEEHDLNFMLPIYLFYMIGRMNILFYISEHIIRLYDFGKEINLPFLKQKIVERFGERDVVIRSTGAFIKTLAYFKVVRQEDKKSYLAKRLKVNEEQTCIILKLYSRDILKSPQLNINALPPALFNYFELGDLRQIAQKYNGQCWDYQHRMNDDFLLMKG
ncbi:MAG: hypothetical protein PWQ68_2279 [Thermoanaerobacteraceae bacterium]|nr:hypothetical protein [Thermoanaerobacteraceae bacterium]